MSHRLLFVAGFGLLATALPANAGLFSFASDNDSNSWTFAGNGASVRDAQDPTDVLTLLVDDDNGPLPTLAFSVEFEANFRLTYLGSVAMGGGRFIHNYSLDGTFSFLSAADNSPVLTGTVSNGAFVALGDQGNWYSTANIQGNDGLGGTMSYSWDAAALPAGYNVTQGLSLGADDMAFTLTMLNGGGPGVSLGQDHLPALSWSSEGSFSGSTVPGAPGAAVLALAGLAVARRRREN